MLALLTENVNISLTDIAIILAVLGVFLDRLADNRGWSRSSKVLRAENTDLLRRNVELDATVKRHEATIVTQDSRILVLEAKLEELKQRDQAAVLYALEKHELQAESRTERVANLLAEIRNAVQQSRGDIIQHGGGDVIQQGQQGGAK